MIRIFSSKVRLVPEYDLKFLVPYTHCTTKGKELSVVTALVDASMVMRIHARNFSVHDPKPCLDTYYYLQF